MCSAASLTLLPAFSASSAQHRPPAGAVHRPAVAPGSNARSGTGGAASFSTVRGSPFIGSAAVLLLITAPLFSLRLGFPDDGNSAKSETSRKAYDLLTEGFGPGFNGPLLLVADLKGGSDTNGTLTKLSEDVKGTDGVAFVAPPVMNPAGDTAVIYAFPKNKPQDEATSKLVSRLRNTVLPATLSGTGTKVLVGGFTAIAIDQSNYIGHRLPFFIGACGPALLPAAHHGVPIALVALKAGIMNLLSIAAAYGIMSFAVSGSWLGNLLNIPETPVPAFVPMIKFAILFGLSMDYEVFLLSRIREEYLRSGDNGVARSPTAWPPRRGSSRPPRPSWCSSLVCSSSIRTPS